METISFEDIKLGFKRLQENNEELQRRFAETNAQFKETDARFKETDARFKETDKKLNAAINLFTSQWGRLLESLVEGDLLKLLQARGIAVHDTTTRRKGTRDGENYEFDIIAHNGKEIVIVEVKTTLKPQDVKDFIAKLKKAKTYMPEYAGNNILGTVAFLQADAGSETFAEAQGLFVIRATGNSASIVNKQEFTPKAF